VDTDFNISLRIRLRGTGDAAAEANQSKKAWTALVSLTCATWLAISPPEPDSLPCLTLSSLSPTGGYPLPCISDNKHPGSIQIGGGSGLPYPADPYFYIRKIGSSRNPGLTSARSGACGIPVINLLDWDFTDDFVRDIVEGLGPWFGSKKKTQRQSYQHPEQHRLHTAATFITPSGPVP